MQVTAHLAASSHCGVAREVLSLNYIHLLIYLCSLVMLQLVLFVIIVNIFSNQLKIELSRLTYHKKMVTSKIKMGCNCLNLTLNPQGGNLYKYVSNLSE